MSRHTQDPICPLCEDKLLEAHPDIATWFRKIKAVKPDCHISWTFRSKEWQDKAVADGKSRLLWPNSYHNHMEGDRPCSMAMDLFQMHPQNIALFPRAYYAEIYDYLKSQDAPIDWGGVIFKSLSDSDHFQLKRAR